MQVGVPSAACFCAAPIKIVVEDGLDGAIGARADINGAFRRRFDASDAIGTGKADDPQTRP